MTGSVLDQIADILKCGKGKSCDHSGIFDSLVNESGGSGNTAFDKVFESALSDGYKAAFGKG